MIHLFQGDQNTPCWCSTDKPARAINGVQHPRYPLCPAISPNSSPNIPSPGRALARISRIAFSAARSATGSNPMPVYCPDQIVPAEIGQNHRACGTASHARYSCDRVKDWAYGGLRAKYPFCARPKARLNQETSLRTRANQTGGGVGFQGSRSKTAATPRPLYQRRHLMVPHLVPPVLRPLDTFKKE